MRLLADENIAREIIRALRAEGHDVFCIGEKHFGMTDSDVYFISIQESRILVTYDLDFSNTVVYSPTQTNGIIVLRYKDQKPAHLASHLTSLLRDKSESDFFGKLMILKEGRIRSHIFTNSN